MAFRILSFCGGGIRGLLSAGYLSRLHERFPKIVEDADMLAGTSTGTDIISLLLDHVPPAKIYEFYINEAPKAFKNPNPITTGPAYNVKELLATQRLLHLIDRRVSHFKEKKLLFTSFNVGSAGKPWTTELFNNFDNYGNGDVPIANAIVGSSSMPGMYGALGGLIDGAFVNHDPTVAAIALAVANGHKLEEISCVTFGTGFMANWIASDTETWGAAQWQNGDGNPENRLPNLLINEQTPIPVLNAMMAGTSTNLQPQLSAMLLGDRYAYLNSTLDRIVAENDISPEAIEYMRACVFDIDLSEAEAVIGRW